MRLKAWCALALLVGLIVPRTGFGWAHQGHILITRLAALRIINDANAPKGLRDFLQANMKHTLADCQTLATERTVGAYPENHPEYTQGLDNWCTMPDRASFLPDGDKKISPYDALEREMHFMDMEEFSGKAYRDDLSSKPKIDQIPHDLHDPRWKRAGFVPWRVEEMYNKLADAFGPGEETAHPEDALRLAGYLAHYVEDSTQPHHATADFKSLSYLMGRLKGLPAVTQPSLAALAQMRAPKGVNPHGDLEFEIFANSNEPLKDFRQEYWKDLLADIDALAGDRAKQPAVTVQTFDPFHWDLEILSDSYDYLPLVGRAAQAGYASGTFDPAAFFGYAGQSHGKQMTTVGLIALQNAKAVLDVEQAYRLAWEKGKKK